MENKNKKGQSQRTSQVPLGVPQVWSIASLRLLLGHRIINKSVIDVTKLPPSYTTNSPKEEHLLQVADHFSRQYSHLCPDRVPLFLYPLNECDVPVSQGLEDMARAGLGGGGRGEVFGSNHSCPESKGSSCPSALAYQGLEEGTNYCRGTQAWDLNWKLGRSTGPNAW